MDEEKKVRLCPDCGQEMDAGFLQISEYAAFNRQRQILSLRPDEEGEVQLTGDGILSDHRGNFHGWICRDCGLILFGYTNNRAGKGKSLLDRMADGIDNAFEALDRHFGGWTTDEESDLTWDKPDPGETPDGSAEKSAGTAPAVPEEKPKKRIITSSGVRMVDDEKE